MIHKESHVFVDFCEKEINKILLKKKRKELDYLKAYVFLHFVLEIQISFLFRLLLLFHVFLKTNHNSLTIKELDKKKIGEKFNLLYELGVKQESVNRLKGKFYNFSEKRNNIAHGYNNGVTYGETIEKGNIVVWVNDEKLKKHFNSYHEIVFLLRGCIDELQIKSQGKEDLKKQLIGFEVTF